MQAAVTTRCPGVAHVAGYHLGWLDVNGEPCVSSGGKALRTALALVSAQAAGADAEQGVPAAIAVELVHNFSLLHDDIIDGDIERRHQPTAWAVFGTSQAILTGNALFTAALALLLEQDCEGSRLAASSLVTASQRLLNGQAADLSFETRDDVTLPESLAMAADKTSALFNCASSIGAALVGGDHRLVSGLSEFGEHLGTAFQLIDDLRGIWGDPKTTGKPALSDLRSRKKTLPLVAAMSSGTRHAAELAALYLHPAAMSDEELHRVADLVEAAGGRRWAEEQTEVEFGAAMSTLAGLAMPEPAREALADLARFALGRDR